MVKLHAYLFGTKMTIRKIPSPATLSQKSSFFLTVSHISRCYSRISIMLAHDPKSSTLCMYVCWFSSLILTVYLKKRQSRRKGLKSLKSWIYISGIYWIMCVFFKGFYLWHYVRWVGGLNTWLQFDVLRCQINMDGAPKAYLSFKEIHHCNHQIFTVADSLIFLDCHSKSML